MEKIQQVGFHCTLANNGVVNAYTTHIVPVTDSTLRAALDLSLDQICVTVS